MKTFILEWNPEISSYRMEHFENDMHYIEYGEFNWSVWDWEKARSGDNFYMVRCSGQKNGIVMKGFFTSPPYEAEDWSGKGRNVHYMDLRPLVMVHPEKAVMLSTGELEKAMPDFQWNGGHSGRELPRDHADVLDRMWDDYAKGKDFGKDDAVGISVNHFPEAGIDEAVSIASEALYDRKDENGRPLILQALERGLSGKTDEERILGFLHDVLSSGEMTAGGLRDRGVPEWAVDALLDRE